MTMKNLTIVLSLVGLLALAIYIAIDVWGALEGTDISTHGWIALGAGVIVTFGLGAGLMFLVFYSNRQGYDDQDSDKD
jgi:hypothetical protein